MPTEPNPPPIDPTLPTAYHAARETSYELIELRQLANSYAIRFADRANYQFPPPPIELPDTAFTPEENRQLNACFQMLEAKIGAAHAARIAAADPVAVNAAIIAMHDAERRRADAEAGHAELDAQLRAKRAELAALAKAAPVAVEAETAP